MRFVYIVVVSNFERLSIAMVFWLDWLFSNPTRLAELAGYTMGVYGLLTCLLYIHTHYLDI